MARPPRRLPRPAAANPEFLALDNVTLRLGESPVFTNTNWVWRSGEHWAILGRDGSGVPLLIQALLGHTPPLQGDIRGPFPSSNHLANASSPSVASVSAQTQRDLAVQESSFYQLRWHSGLEQGPRTVADYLSQDSVEGRNPFEVAPLQRNRRSFLHRRRHLVERLGLQPLFRRRLLHLSNGEMRKTLVAHHVLAAPSSSPGHAQPSAPGLDRAAAAGITRPVPRTNVQ